MKKVIKVLFAFTVLFVSFPVWADTTIHLEVKTPSNTFYDGDITVTPCDSDNPSTGTLKTAAYCAVLQSGLSNDWNFAWAPGIFLNSLGGVSGSTTTDGDGNPVYHYWSWSSNGAEGMVGLNQYELQPGDLITLNFIDPIPAPAPEPEVIHTPHGGGGSSINLTLAPTAIKPIFNTEKAFNFLISEQKENGSFGEDLYTDWTALALASSPDYKSEKIKLANYLKENKPTGTMLTDYERHSMALLALGLDPKNINGENYIAKILSGFDGKQFGNPTEDNDDIFALIVLQNTDSLKNETILKNTIDFILSRQKENGSWNESVDMTGAGMEALAYFAGENKQVKSALAKAREFLKEKQKDDGGWENVSSTAWAMQGILALGEKPANWVKNGNIPFDYFALNQDTDGGIKNQNKESKIWETAYALASLSGNPWNQVMQKFATPTTEKQMVLNKINGAGKVEISSSLLGASVAEAISQTPKTNIETKKGNLFKNFLSKIWSIFF